MKASPHGAAPRRAPDPAGRSLLLATGNAHKVEEMTEILGHLLPGVPSTLRTAAEFPAVPEPEESGDTYASNALIKARAYASATGLLTLADDSGLEIEALGGRPGIGSARFAPTVLARIERAWREMAEVPDAAEGARFVCVVALVDATGRHLTARGEVRGRIIREMRGVGGFGYDPIFLLDEPDLPGITMAELDRTAKNRVSHRARALAALAPALGAALATGQIAESL